jgi:glutathionyl-hydroquinone reductase
MAYIDADSLERRQHMTEPLMNSQVRVEHRTQILQHRKIQAQSKRFFPTLAFFADAFDAAAELLDHQRYLTGDFLTDADIRLFVTLLRFDEVYAFYFRANTRLVMMAPSLLNFCREIYQMPGVAETCQMDQIKAHFFGSHAEWNKYSVVPRGLGFMKQLQVPHDRDGMEEFGQI